MTNNVIVSLFLGLGIFGTPGFLMVIWLMWREIRDTQDLADHFIERNHELYERLREYEKRENAWLADW